MPNFIINRNIQETFLAVADTVEQAEKALADGTAVLTTRTTGVGVRPQPEQPQQPPQPQTKARLPQPA